MKHRISKTPHGPLRRHGLLNLAAKTSRQGNVQTGKPMYSTLVSPNSSSIFPSSGRFSPQFSPGDAPEGSRRLRRPGGGFLKNDYDCALLLRRAQTAQTAQTTGGREGKVAFPVRQGMSCVRRLQSFDICKSLYDSHLGAFLAKQHHFSQDHQILIYIRDCETPP